MSNHSIRITAALLLTLFTLLSARAAQSEAALPNSRNSAPGTKPSVLERFRAYSGQRTPDDLIRLFYAPVAADSVQQKTQVALSNGKTDV